VELLLRICKTSKFHTFLNSVIIETLTVSKNIRPTLPRTSTSICW